VSDSIKDVAHALCALCLVVVAFALFASIAAAQVVEPDKDAESPRERPKFSSQVKQTSETATCDQIVALLQQQQGLITRELAQVRREMVVFREAMAQPGLKDVFSGIGYILGIAGIAFYFHCKRSQKDL
jgi:nickel transport protein